MKKIAFYLSTLAAIGIVATSCLKQPDNGGKPQDPIQNFDWKTTKSIPVNVIADDNESIPVLIYNGTELVAGGYTPFNENITVPKSCSQLSVVPGVLPVSYFTDRGRSATRAEGEQIDVKTVRAGDATTVSVKNPKDDGHKYLYQQVESIFGRQPWVYTWDWFANTWWNDAPSGGKVLYGITLLDDQLPEFDKNDKLVDVPHICSTEGCTYNINPGVAPEETDDKFITVNTPAGTYIFEDLFPSMGDYDMNDFVVKEESALKIWANNKVKSVKFTYTVNAAGSAKKIALAVRLFGLKQHDVESITMYRVGEDGVSTTPYSCTNASGLFSIEANGLETASDNDEVVIPIFENFFNLIPRSAIGFGFNTKREADGGKGDPLSFIVEVVFDKNSRNIKLSEFKSDLFIMVASQDQTAAQQRGNEIHVVGAQYTSKMNTALFGTEDDASVMPDKCFRAKNGYVWAIYLPSGNFDWPLENIKLDTSYPSFKKWIETSGENINYQNWFKNMTYGKTWETSK